MTEPIRILRVVARMNVGGPALQVTALQRGLDPERFEARLLVGAVGPDEGDHLALHAPGLAVTPVPGLGRRPHPIADIQAFLALRAAIRRFRPHIVHTHTAKAGMLGRLAAWAARSPATVHTFHGHLLHGYFGPAATRTVVLAERMLARRTDRLLAVGTQVRDELLAARIGRAHQYEVVPPGVPRPITVPRDEARTVLGLAPDAEVVAFVGRLTIVKRPDRVLEVFRRVAAGRPRATLLVAGDGELADRVRSSTSDLGARVHLLGWRSDLGRIYAASDVALLASDNEGMPVSLIEAAMSGVPAVTTDVGSAGEVVLDGQTGYLTERRVDALASAVLRLLDDPERRRRFGDAACEHASRRFGVARLVADTERIYDDLVAERNRR